MQVLDLEELQRLVAENPELLRPPAHDAARGGNLLNIALGQERRQGREAMQPIMEWLASQGLDLQRELNMQLCGRIKFPTDKVRELLDRGADPNWVAPNGVPVLEYALIRYWNAEAVDLLAAHARPRKALWIAAGLGDVDGVDQFLDRNGRPTAEARRLRPPFDLVGPMMLSHPDPDDDEILIEAFVVAIFNGRIPVLEYMAAHGTPINSLVYGSPVINFAVGNAWPSIVECLVRWGADPELRGYQPEQSARELARGCFEEMPGDADRRRIVELLGMDPDVILAERDARPETAPEG
jgi:ankyrin repeat protein